MARDLTAVTGRTGTVYAGDLANAVEIVAWQDQRIVIDGTTDLHKRQSRILVEGLFAVRITRPSRLRRLYDVRIVA